MRSEQLRALLLEYLKSVASRRDKLQYTHCLSGVEGLAQQHCPNELGGSGQLRDEDGARLKHVIWDLILERILIPGTDSPRATNDGWPFLSLTDHGRKVASEQKPLPYDPDGYLARLRSVSGGLHPTVERYLGEAISTHRTGNNLASAVMLGAGSERLFIDLCVAVAESLSNASHRSAFERRSDRSRRSRSEQGRAGTAGPENDSTAFGMAKRRSPFSD